MSIPLSFRTFLYKSTNLLIPPRISVLKKSTSLVLKVLYGNVYGDQFNLPVQEKDENLSAQGLENIGVQRNPHPKKE